MSHQDTISLADGDTLPVQETSAVWIDLENDLQIRFSGGGHYRTGDYLLIPAHVASGNVE